MYCFQMSISKFQMSKKYKCLWANVNKANVKCQKEFNGHKIKLTQMSFRKAVSSFACSESLGSTIHVQILSRILNIFFLSQKISEWHTARRKFEYQIITFALPKKKEDCSSGWRGTPGKRVKWQHFQEFESLILRFFFFYKSKKRSQFRLVISASSANGISRSIAKNSAMFRI